ncbi:formyltetrahydrofolate deformylase [Pleomorphomonas sp. NRK KF1]|uniref:formyltetrahydrofolate deformylase n=1 Tax=Pleomorphomonas sp. NRK KF1 TaxID=2943000 RepID=UPI002042FB89|nr:formyltetrahydrofolate deformylase [Pleomorphomonas sp. NRK KF1]MCM5553673.1 formyltetrahydrofolate deformylase [Pleomorphomonas sp. NRK KF1]
MADANKRTHILTLSCADRPRIVASVTTILAGLGGNIAESAQFWDRVTNRFFMRIAFETPAALSAETIRAALSDTIETFGMTVDLVDAARTPKIVIMVSKFDHCLQHLMYQIRVGWLKAEVAAIVSNHEDSRAFAEAQGIPYYCWPVDKDKSNKEEQEAKVMALVEETGAELVVLARYMQVLSDKLSSALFGKVINIHHSFLPSFKGARPYHQAHERGVKLIGATAHYVTPDLDEGPIIEQETSRVTHALSAEDLVAVGRDNESRVLARAVKLHLEARVLMHGKKTIVFA